MPFVTPGNFIRTIQAARRHVYGDIWEGPPENYEDLLERRKTRTGHDAIAYLFGPNRGQSTCRGPGYMLHSVEPLEDEPIRTFRNQRVPESQLPVRTIEERLAQMLGKYSTDDDILVVFVGTKVTVPFIATEIDDPELQACCERMLRERQQDEEMLQKYLADYDVKRSAFLPPKWTSAIPTEPGEFRFRRAGLERDVHRLDVVSFEGQLHYLHYGRPVRHLWQYEFAPCVRDLTCEDSSGAIDKGV